MARNERRVWASVQLTADPHKENHLYVIQELLGSYVTNDAGFPEFIPTPSNEPILTRVLYARMSETGKLENVNSGSWEGRRDGD